MKTCGIYCIHNLANGMIYVGQSVHLEARRRDHFAELKRGVHSNSHFQRAFTKYGMTSFEFRILEKVTEEMLDIRECAWIRYYKSNQRRFGYNSEAGGSLNKHLSDEHRRRIGEANRGRKHSVELRHDRSIAMSDGKSWHCGKHRAKSTRCKISEALKGHSVSEDTRRKISKAQKGKPGHGLGSHRSIESRRKMSEARKGKKHSPATRRKMSKAQKMRWKERRRK